MINSIVALRHQNNYVNMVRLHPEITYTFLIGGYGSGKSFSDVILLMTLIGEYQYVETPINIGVLGVTIKLLRRTVIADLLRFMDLSGLTYQHNSQAGYITVGNVTITYLQMQNPDDIYAFNFNCALVDELDELDAEKVPAVIKAIQERCRKVMPTSRNFPRRSSFIVFSTTAQGLGGTYHLIKSFDKQNALAKSQGKPAPLPYAIIRAKTEDNPHNDPEQIKRLRALYTKEEADAYLDGKFMNLANGRVWYSFDRRKNMCMRFPINPTEQVYVGQDFNLGINASIEFIVRGSIMYVIHSHHWLDMGDAAIRLRQYYPTNPIMLLPDASGKEIMQGFMKEYNANNIAVHWNSKNPSITERVMAGNMMFRTGRLFIMQPEADEELRKDDIENVLMALETHDIDEKTGKPRKGVGIKAPDHCCFVAGTKIATLRGEVPIEQVTTKDYVLGADLRYHKVYWAGCSGKKAVITKWGLTGTASHPIARWRPNLNRHIKFDALGYANSYNYLDEEDREWLRQLNSMVLNIEDILMHNARAIGNITELVSAINNLREFVYSTEIFGLSITDQFQRVMIYITKMEIHRTTLLRTWNVYRVMNMLRCMLKQIIMNFHQKHGSAQLPGTKAQRATSGTCETTIPMKNSAPGAIRCILRHPLRAATEVLAIIRGKSSAVEVARSNTITQYEMDVYDLSVTGSHTFFANGILSHNSDSLGYGIWRVINNIQGYDDILEALASTRRHGSNDD